MSTHQSFGCVTSLPSISRYARAGAWAACAALSLAFSTVTAQTHTGRLASTSPVTQTFVFTLLERDPVRGSIVVSDSSGQRHTFNYDPRSSRLSILNPGDKLTAAVSNSVALDMVAPGSAKRPRESVSLSEPLPGTSDATTIVREVIQRFTVEAVRHATSQIVLRNDQGIRTVDVIEPALRSALASVRAGDVVDVTVSESMTVSPIARP